MKYFFDACAGIGGFALSAYWAGLRFDEHYFSEIDDYAIQIYKKRFPEAIYIGDIKNVDYRKLPRGDYLVTSGFPCQPNSIAGKRQGSKDERDLWNECSRMLCELRPTIALFENVPGIFTAEHGEYFNRVLSDISQAGYGCEWDIISAAEVGAPHLRERIWIVAYADTKLNTGRSISRKRKKGKQELQGLLHADFRLEISECEIYGENNGLPRKMDRIRCLGNAIVPQVCETIFRLSAFDLWREE